MLQSRRRIKRVNVLSLNWPDRVVFRSMLAGEQGWRCCYCGCRMIHHGRHPNSVALHLLLPARLGGSYAYENCVACCRTCSDDRQIRICVEQVDAMAIGAGMRRGDVYRAVQELQLERSEDVWFRAAA